MNKRNFGILLVFALLAVVIIWNPFHVKRPRNGQNIFPSNNEIKSMSAVWFTPGGPYKFTVEPEFYSKILNELQPAQEDNHPDNRLALASLQLTCNDGKKIAVELFHAEGTGAYWIKTPEDPIYRYYRAGNTWTFITVLREMCEASKDKKKIDYQEDEY